MLGKIGGRRRRGQQKMRWLDGINGLNAHEFEQTRGDGEGQGSLACGSQWGCKESDMTEQLNNNKCMLAMFINVYLLFYKELMILPWQLRR